MATRCVINVDLADVWEERGRKKYIRTLAWGDEVTVLAEKSTHIEIALVAYKQYKDGSILPDNMKGYIEPSKSSGVKAAETIRKFSENEVLRVNFVDVQQGDAAVIESPDGKVILVDGGDNQMFARYLAGRFRGTSLSKPKDIECILVSHGDADHFAGLPEIYESENNPNKKKRLFIRPKRIYHNGLVKRPSTMNKRKVPDSEMLGPTKKTAEGLYIVGLEQDLLKVDDAKMNKNFLAWKNALKEYNKRGKIEFRRLEFGDTEAFDFFNTDDMKIEVFGPNTEQIGGKPALKFLGNPPKGPRIGHESLDTDGEAFKGHSVSHTINGHSIVFRLSYGGFSYLFAGDLNDEASRFLANQHNLGTLNLRSEVLKVPHHGSADFSGAFIQAVSPVINIVSSGDENSRKEYIHPRATLMGALGKCSRVPEPLIFVTELVAFFKTEGWSRSIDEAQAEKDGDFFGFSRTAYGLIKTRTDGKRLFIYTDSGNVKMKEAYAYQLDSSGVPQPAPVVRV